jgi:hypothetical protein
MGLTNFQTHHRLWPVAFQYTRCMHPHTPCHSPSNCWNLPRVCHLPPVRPAKCTRFIHNVLHEAEHPELNIRFATITYVLHLHLVVCLMRVSGSCLDALRSEKKSLFRACYLVLSSKKQLGPVNESSLFHSKTNLGGGVTHGTLIVGASQFGGRVAQLALPSLSA